LVVGHVRQFVDVAPEQVAQLASQTTQAPFEPKYPFPQLAVHAPSNKKVAVGHDKQSVEAAAVHVAQLVAQAVQTPLAPKNPAPQAVTHAPFNK
jgi:hypothetical protein